MEISANVRIAPGEKLQSCPGGGRIPRMASIARTAITISILCFLTSGLSFSQSEQHGTTAASQSKKADTTVFGMHLGEKLSLPECKRMKKPIIQYDEYYADGDPQMQCFKRDDAATTKPDAPLGTTAVSVYFPVSEEPQIGGFGASFVSGWVIEGNLETVDIETIGVHCQDGALAQLKEKYGEPSSLREENQQNRMGAVFTAHVANWQFTNLTVSFHGIEEELDEGHILIMTNKGRAFVLDLAERKKTGPKL
jgi:hypothetical protein